MIVITTCTLSVQERSERPTRTQREEKITYTQKRETHPSQSINNDPNPNMLCSNLLIPSQLPTTTTGRTARSILGIPTTIMTGSNRIIERRTGNFTGQFLECLALRLGDEIGGKDAEEHEEGVDLHDVVEPGGSVVGGGATDAQRADEDLGDDGAHFAGGGRDAVRGGSVPGWEAFAGHDEGGGVGAEVEEELPARGEVSVGVRGWWSHEGIRTIERRGREGHFG